MRLKPIAASPSPPVIVCSSMPRSLTKRCSSSIKFENCAIPDAILSPEAVVADVRSLLDEGRENCGG